MTTTLTYSDFWEGFLALEYLRYDLDYAMWQFIEVEAEPIKETISLRRDPIQALDTEIDDLIAVSKDELVYMFLRCSRCGAEFGRGSTNKACPRLHWHTDSKDSKARSEECGGELLELYRIDESEERIRENARFALARRGNLVFRIATVSAWLQREMPLGTDHDTVPVTIVFKALQERMEHELAKVFHHVPNIDLNIGRRPDLLPSGESLAEKHTDYSTLRYAIINAERKLVGEARNLPEFKEDEDAPNHIIVPPERIMLPSGVSFGSKIGELEEHIEKIVGEKIQMMGAPNVIQSLEGYLSADTLTIDHGIARNRLSEGKKAEKIRSITAPPGCKDSQGRPVKVLYHKSDALKYARPGRSKASNPIGPAGI